MDAFAKFPPELRLLMLESLFSFEEAITFSHVSSIWFQLFNKFKGSICLAHVRRHLDDGLMQDAMAIINFPQAPESLDKSARDREVLQHLHQWGRKSLPDPTKSGRLDFSMIFELESLCTWLWLYIDDYLSKATSDSLPQAYGQLPKWSPSSKRRARLLPQQRIQPNQGVYVDRDSLTGEQQRQILRAFLRYELLCRVYGPFGNDLSFVETNETYWRDRHQLNEGEAFGVTDGYSLTPNDPFRHWDWTLLNRMEGKDALSPEVQLLPCVREYIYNLHGAYFTDKFQLQRVPTSNPTIPERFRTYHFDDSRYDWPTDRTWDDVILSLLASSGLNAITEVLVSGEQPNDTFYFPWYQQPRITLTNVNVPLDGPSSSICNAWHATDFIRLYRQRAWPLFKDRKPNPNLSLPTAAQYAEVFGPGPFRGRVKWGLNEENARNERICHGSGIWTSENS